MDLDKPASPARLRRYTGPMTTQDSPHGPGAELVHRASRETLGSPDASELGSPTPSFDLLQMVVSSRRLALLLEPLTDALEVARYLLGWRMPLVSLLVCLLLNTFLLTITEGGWLCVCLLGVATPAALGYLQDRCGGGATDCELQRGRFHGVQRRDLQTVRLGRQEAMLEVKDLLKRLDEMLYSTCLSAESVYKVLYWDDHLRSSRFYGAVLLLLLLLFSAPLGWLLVVLNSALFLWNRDFCRVLLGLKELLSPGRTQPADADAERPVQDLGSLPDRTPTPPSLEDLSPGSVEEAEEAEPDDEFKDAIEESLLLQEDDDVAGGVPDYDTISDNGLLSRNEPIRSKVSKLTEKLRKRYPSTNPGNCSSCAAVFSVLKKRRSCSNCGNSFCSRCCSFKVLRSSMGATAPEAQRETVFVCAPCNSSLNKLL